MNQSLPRQAPGNLQSSLNSLRIDRVLLRTVPQIPWRYPHAPERAWEIRRAEAGVVTGETLGWIGHHEPVGYEYVPPAGYAARGGLAPSPDEALAALIAITEAE